MALLANEVDVSKITYGAPKTLDTGAKHIRLSYNRGPLNIQTPDMMAPFGHSAFEGTTRFSIQLSFQDIDDRPELLEFKNMLLAIDKKIVDDAFSGVLATHSKKFTSREVAEIMYQPIVKMPKDEKYSPTMKVNLPVGDKGEFSFPTYAVSAKSGEGPKLADLKTIQTKGAVCTAIMTCTGIYCSGGTNFGVTFKATQLRVQPTVSKTDYAFKDPFGKFAAVKADDEEDIDEAAMNDADERAAVHKDAEEDEEEDAGDEEEEDEEDPMEAPVAKVTAKAATAKATRAKK